MSAFVCCFCSGECGVRMGVVVYCFGECAFVCMRDFVSGRCVWFWCDGVRNWVLWRWEW